MHILIDPLPPQKKPFFSVFRIRIWSDLYHLAGSGSTSGNVDPASKKNRNKLKLKINQNYKNIFIFLNHLFCLIHMNNKLINYKQTKNIVMIYHTFYRKQLEFVRF